MEESTWKTVTLKLKRIACLNLELITFQLLQSPISNAKSVTLMISQLIRLNTFMDIVALDGWLILPFVKYFCSLVQLHYSLLSSFIRKQQLAKYPLLLCWISDLLYRQRLPNLRTLIAFYWHIFVKGLDIAHLDTWIFPLRLEIASNLELASGRLVGPTDWTKCRTVYLAQQTGRNVELLYRFLRFG